MASPDAAEAATSTVWKSLFLPLAEDERVAFCSFFTLVKRDFNGLHVVNDSETQRDHILCVMENQSVAIFDLSTSDGPKKISGFTAAREMKSSANYDERVIATCASTIPLELSFACHLHCESNVRSPNAYEPPAPLPQDEGTASLGSVFRGVVGSSNGRVDVFTEASYAFGFPAHKCPVVHVQAIFVGDSAHPSTHPDDNNTVNVVSSSQPGGANNTFSTVTNVLGFVTMGEDGCVLVWRRRADGFRREKLITPSLMSKCHAIHAALPVRSLPIQMDALAPRIGGDAGSPNDEGLYSPQTSFSPASQQALNSRTTAKAPSSQPPGYRLAPSLIFSGGNGFSNTVKVRSCESMKSMELDVSLDGVFSRTSAIAVDGPICIVAREKVVYAVDYEERTCKRIFTATSVVKHLVVRSPLVVAGCESGKIYVVNGNLGTVLGTSYTYSAAPVISLSFVSSALLLAVVDETNCVEVFQLPEKYLRQPTYKRFGAFDPLQSAAADVLQKYVALQECSTGMGTASNVRSAVAEEQLLLSRLLVPEEVSTYLRLKHRLL